MKYFLKFKFVLIIILLLTLLNTICFFPLINFKNSSHFFYKEIIYTHISHNLINSDKFKTIFNVFDYVYFNVDDEYSASFNIVDENSFVDLVRGFGLCDQQSFIFMNLLNKLGFQSRLRDVNQHTYSEIYVNNKWIIADPYYGYIFFDRKNNFLDINEIQSLNYDQISDYLRLTNLNLSESNLLNFKNIYKPNYLRWPNSTSQNFINYRNYDFYRKFFETYANFNYKIFGKLYLYIFQDLYLNIYKTKLLHNEYQSWIPMHISQNENIKSDFSFELFYLARNYHLSNRYTKSQKLYEKNIINFPNTLWTKESYYFLAQIYFENKNYNNAIELLNHISDYDLRLSKINYYIGMSYFYLNDLQKAKKYLNKSDFLYSNLILNDFAS